MTRNASAVAPTPDFAACLLSLAGSGSSAAVHPCSPFLEGKGFTLTQYELASIWAPVAAYWVYCVVLHYICPHLRFLDRYKINTAQARRPKNRVSFGQVISAVVLQHAIQMTLATAVALLSHDPVEGSRVEPLPTLAFKVLMGMFILDTWEYWLHRWMHTYPLLYRTFHSVHHRLTENYSFGALYNHPIEGLVLDTVGGAVASQLTGMTPHTAAIFYTIATIKTVDDHSGYCWPWVSVLFANNAKYHDVHHWGKGIKFNYAQPFFTFWDTVGGTHWELPDDQLPADDKSDADQRAATLAVPEKANGMNGTAGKTANGTAGKLANGTAGSH